MEKRTWAYTQPPKDYEVAACSCGNSDTQWSEYKKHLWCSRCEKDFIPKHNGIFDGPIMIELSKAMGMHFTRVQLATNQLEAMSSLGDYIPVLEYGLGPVSVVLKHNEYTLEGLMENGIITGVPMRHCHAELFFLNGRTIDEYSFFFIPKNDALSVVEEDDYRKYVVTRDAQVLKSNLTCGTNSVVHKV